MRVKVCGVTRLEDAQLAVELGAAAIGFIFWSGSPRAIAADRAQAIVRALPAFVTPVGVFVDEASDVVEAVAEKVGLGAVQLHGHETPAYVEAMRRPVIRAVGVDETLDVSSLATWLPEVVLLLDAHDPERRGGTGRTIDWQLAGRIAASRRTILSGGLRPENVGAAVQAVAPYAVDVSSGIEAAPGIKDAGRMRAFFQAVDIAKESKQHRS